MGKIIAIANQKGGVAKTTTAINLSACLAAAGRRVLAVDFDPQGNLTSGFGFDRREIEKEICDVLLNETQIQDVILTTEIPGMQVVPAGIQLAEAEIKMIGLQDREFLLKQALSGIAGSFDYIFIDCPPSLGLLTVNALTAADSVMIPIQCEYYALEGLSQLMGTVDLVKDNLNPYLYIEGVLLTMFDARTNLGLEVVAEVRKHFSTKVYKTIISRNVRLSEAPSHGQPIIIYDPKSRGAEVYQELAKEVMASE